MLPPICEICDERFDPFETEGGLVSFKLTPEQSKNNDQMFQQGMTGHPEGSYWFCEKHFPVAEKFQHLTSAEAIPQIREACFLL